MVDDEKGGEAEVKLTGTEADGLDWGVRMTEVQRIEPDPEDDEPEDIFAVTFTVDGPNTNAEVEITVVDAADIEVVAMALDTMHGALLVWDLIQRRREAAQMEMTEG